jgi:hypothetical protein
MLRTNAGIVSGDSGGPLSDTSGKVIGMDTAGNNASMPGQPASTGFAIPISTAMSIARQIESGQASQEVTIGYPPFLGIFVAQGKSSNPQKQAQQQSQGVGGGFGGFGGSGGGSGRQGWPDRRLGHHRRERAGRRRAEQPDQRAGRVPPGPDDLRQLGQPVRPPEHQQHSPDRRATAVTGPARRTHGRSVAPLSRPLTAQLRLQVVYDDGQDEPARLGALIGDAH